MQIGSKIKILAKNQNFGQKSKLGQNPNLVNMQILVKNPNLV